MSRIFRTLSFALIGLVATGSLARAADHVYVPSGAWPTSWVDVVDPQADTLVTTIKVGTTPRGIAVSPDRRRVYVANQHSDNMSVIETATNSVIATIPLGGSPFGVAVSPNGSRVYVTNINDDTVSVIDTTTFTVLRTIAIPASVPWGSGPRGIVVNPAGTRVYTANWLDSSVTVIDATTNTVIRNIPLGKQTVHLAINPAGTRLYVGTWPDISQPVEGTAPLFVINTQTNQVIAAPEVATCESVSVSPDGARVYAPHRFNNYVAILDTATNSVIARVPVTGVAFFGSLNRAGTKLYLVNTTEFVQTIDTTTFAVTSTRALVNYGSYAFSNSFVVDSPDPCVGLSVQPGTLAFPNFGGAAGFQVNAGPNCKWVAYSGAPWAHLSLAAGIGPAFVFVNVDPNRNPFPRGTTVWVVPAGGSGPGVPVNIYQD